MKRPTTIIDLKKKGYTGDKHSYNKKALAQKRARQLRAMGYDVKILTEKYNNGSDYIVFFKHKKGIEKMLKSIFI